MGGLRPTTRSAGFSAEDTALAPPSFGRMFLLDPYDMDNSGIQALENTGSPTLNVTNLPR